MARFFDPGEMQRLETFSAQQRQRAVYAQQTTRQQVQQVGAMRAAYPFMAPGVVVPVALSGATPEDAAPIAQAEVKRKSKSGFGWHSFGDVIKGGVKGGIKAAKTAGNVSQGFVRGTFMGVESIGQTFQGAMRESTTDGDISGSEWLAGLPHLRKGFEQSNLNVAHDQIKERGGYAGLLTGKTDVDYGSGFFAGGEVTKEQTRRARATAPLINGHAPTIGRYAAAQFRDPGTVQYNMVSGLVDAAVAIASDPSGVFGKGVSTSIKAGKQFAEPGVGRIGTMLGRVDRPRDVFSVTDRGLERHAAGLLDGDTRKTVLPERVGEWLQSKSGQAVVSKLVESTSAVELRKTFGKQIDTETLVSLANSKNVDEVYDILGPKLGVDIRQKIALPGAIKAQVRRSLDNVRMVQQMPGQHIDLSDADDAVDNLDKFMRNAKIDPAVRDRRVEEMMRATSQTQRYEILTKSVRSVTERFVEEGLTKAGDDAMRRREARDKAKGLTRLFEEYNEDLRKYFVDQVGDNVRLPGAVVDGEVKVLASPHLLGEYLNRAVPLPDARDIRRETSKIMGLVGKVPFAESAFKTGTTLGDFVSGSVFKRLVLLRPAYTVRVIGEEQVRLAASGQTSMFVHPMSHIAMMVGADSRTAKVLNKVGVQGGRMSTGIDGGDLRETDQYVESLNKGLKDYMDPSVTRTKNWITLGRQETGYVEAWSDELAELFSDPIAQRVAGGGPRAGEAMRPGFDGIKDWFFDGAGREFRNQLADAPDRAWLNTREGADAYIDSIVDRVQVKTGGDPDLMSVVASGRFGGERVFEPVAVGKNGTRNHQKGTRALLGDLARRAEDQLGPERVKGQQVISGRLEAGQRALAGYDRATDHAFSYLMTRPTNFLSRSPAFRTFYYERAEELIGFMTKDAQTAAIQAAQDAGVAKDALRRMKQRAAQGSGEVDLESADLLAKGHALDATKDLLYDMHERSQFFDITRLLFPFGEAWKEVMTTWAKIGTENPLMFGRAGLAVQGARDLDPDGDGKGFFYSDDLTGEEMFSIPLVGGLAETFAGLPDGSVRFEATAKGANVFSQSVIPGFGPMAQIPASKVLPDDPDWDEVRKILLPFGATDTSGGFFESFAPAYVKKLMTGLAPRGEGQERAFMNVQTEAMRALGSTGEYANTPENQERLINDAKGAARKLFAIRALAQSTAPSAPMWEFLAKSKDGELISTFALSQEYRELQEADYRTATEKFVAKFGEGAFQATIGKSTGPSVSKGAYDWSRENPEEARAFKDVYGYFVGGKDDKLDLTAFQRQFDTGERAIRTPEDAKQLADQRLGRMIVAAAQSKVTQKNGKPAPNESEKAWLRTVKDAVSREYPGFVAASFDPAKTPRLIKQTLAAANNDVIGQTDAGKGVQAYAAARERAIAAAREMGLDTFARSKDAVGIRDWLRSVAAAIQQEHPDFADVYDNVLSRELPDDDERAA